jgi:hypothetical protein
VAENWTNAKFQAMQRLRAAQGLQAKVPDIMYFLQFNLAESRCCVGDAVHGSGHVAIPAEYHSLHNHANWSHTSIVLKS